MVATKTKPTQFEIDCAKVLRSIGCHMETHNKNTYWMQECYFNIQDNGIDEAIRARMANMLKLYGAANHRSMADMLYTAPKPQEQKVFKHKIIYKNVYAGVCYIAYNGFMRNIPIFEQEHIHDVLKMVCDELEISFDDAVSRSRKPDFVVARLLTANLCRGRATLQSLATSLGRDNHTSILHYFKELESVLSKNKQAEKAYYTIKQKTGL